jgi:Ca-activated chloride channel family protein
VKSCAVLAPLVLLCSLQVAYGQTIVAPSQAPTQQPAQLTTDEVPTLRVTSRVVALSAVVRGKDNVPIQGLTKDDFELKQDGKDVPIRYFSEASELPLTLALVVDTSGSQRTLIGDEVVASDVFFQTMLGRPEDRATLLRVDAEVDELIPMTNSPSRLHLGLLGLFSRPSSANGTRLQDAIYAVSKLTLAKQTGRKAIVVLSDGGDNGSRISLEDAIHEAQQFNVQIYCIDYSIFNYAMDLNHSLGGVHAGGVDKGEEILKKLAEQTGGRMYNVGKMNLRTIYEQIGRDLRTQYELGYTPPPDLKPGSFHRLELRTRDKKQMVQARNGFTFEP